jgi:hypothetical protein
MNTTTKRYPRTMTDAFGPYADGPIQEEQDPMPVADKIAVWTGAIGLVLVLALMVVGVIQ